MELSDPAVCWCRRDARRSGYHPDPEQHEQLTSWARGRSTSHRLVLRARIVLAAADGRENRDIASELGCNVKTVGQWRTRFAAGGVEAIKKDRPCVHPERTVLGTEVEDEIVWRTTQDKPPNSTQWSTRTMAKVMGVSENSVRRVWKRQGLKPHLTRTFKLSNDPKFAEKLDDIVGLYMNPPDTRWCSRSTRRARSRHSTGRNLACR